MNPITDVKMHRTLIDENIVSIRCVGENINASFAVDFDSLKKALETDLGQMVTDAMRQNWKIVDETLGHTVNTKDITALVVKSPEDYNKFDAMDWYGDIVDAEKIAESLRIMTGHEFVIRRR